MVGVSASGEQTGSVSGGCVEEALIADMLAGGYDQRAPNMVEFGVSAEQNERLGLPCGGKLQLVIQQLHADDSAWLVAACDTLSRRQVVRRRVDFSTGDTVLTTQSNYESLKHRDHYLEHSLGPRARLVLVGAGQLAACIASLAIAMDYEVMVTDSRDWALEQWAGPEVELVLGMPDDVIRDMANDRLTAVMTLSHDPRVDDMALMEALESDVWYVGALGSRRTTATRLARLQKLGVPQTALERLHAPIGIDIGSKTPMEIAIATMAELVQLRRREKD